MITRYTLGGIGFILCLSMGIVAGPAPAQLRPPAPEIDQQNVLFRTKSYVAQIIWRRGIPYMTVSNNGWRVLSDVRARVLPPRGIADQWTTYTAVSGDYLAYVRVSGAGAAAIEVTQSGRRVTEEYATLPTRQRLAPVDPDIKGTAILMFETLDYAVRVFQQQGNLFMNLYNKKTETTDLKHAPVTLVNTSQGVVYRHDGPATVQAREDVRGRCSLLIIRDNAIQYRGEAL